jgi:hypothetical protein
MQTREGGIEKSLCGRRLVQVAVEQKLSDNRRDADSIRQSLDGIAIVWQ